MTSTTKLKVLRIINKISPKMFVSLYDFKWSIYSWLRTPLTKAERVYCYLFGHLIRGDTLLFDKKKMTLTGCCKRCIKVIIWSIK